MKDAALVQRDNTIQTRDEAPGSTPGGRIIPQNPFKRPELTMLIGLGGGITIGFLLTALGGFIGLMTISAVNATILGIIYLSVREAR